MYMYAVEVKCCLGLMFGLYYNKFFRFVIFTLALLREMCLPWLFAQAAKGKKNLSKSGRAVLTLNQVM